VYNLENLLKNNIEKVSEHLRSNERMLSTLPDEKNKLERLKRIFEK
jgi:hypothetical protein